MTWAIAVVIALLRAARGAARRRVGVPDGEPAGPAARPLRPVLAGARRRAGPARGGGARGRRRRLRRRRAGRQAAGGAGRRRRAGAARGAGGRRERAVGGAVARSIPHRCRAALVAELADAEARVLLARRFHNDAVRDTLALRERRPVRLAAAGRDRGDADVLRDRRAGEVSTRDGRRRHRGARRRGWCCSTSDGAVLLFCGSDPASADSAGAPVVVHRRRRGAGRGVAGAGRGARTGRGDRSGGARRRTWSVRCGGATRSSTSTAR